MTPGAEPLDPRSAIRAGPPTPSPRPGNRQPCLPGGRDGSRAPFRRDVQEKQSPSPRPGARQPCLPGGCNGSRAPFRRAHGKKNAVPASRARQPSLRGRNPPFRGRLTHGHACFSHYSTAFHGQNPTAVGVCPKRRIFLKMSKKPLLPCRGFLLPVSLLKFCFSFVFGSVNAQTLCLFVHQAQNYIRTYTVEPA